MGSPAARDPRPAGGEIDRCSVMGLSSLVEGSLGVISCGSTVVPGGADAALKSNCVMSRL